MLRLFVVSFSILSIHFNSANSATTQPLSNIQFRCSHDEKLRFRFLSSTSTRFQRQYLHMNKAVIYCPVLVNIVYEIPVQERNVRQYQPKSDCFNFFFFQTLYRKCKNENNCSLQALQPRCNQSDISNGKLERIDLQLFCESVNREKRRINFGKASTRYYSYLKPTLPPGTGSETDEFFRKTRENGIISNQVVRPIRKYYRRQPNTFNYENPERIANLLRQINRPVKLSYPGLIVDYFRKELDSKIDNNNKTNSTTISQQQFLMTTKNSDGATSGAFLVQSTESNEMEKNLLEIDSTTNQSQFVINETYQQNNHNLNGRMTGDNMTMNIINDGNKNRSFMITDVKFRLTTKSNDLESDGENDLIGKFGGILENGRKLIELNSQIELTTTTTSFMSLNDSITVPDVESSTKYDKTIGNSISSTSHRRAVNGTVSVAVKELSQLESLPNGKRFIPNDIYPDHYDDSFRDELINKENRNLDYFGEQLKSNRNIFRNTISPNSALDDIVNNCAIDEDETKSLPQDINMQIVVNNEKVQFPQPYQDDPIYRYPTIDNKLNDNLKIMKQKFVPLNIQNNSNVFPNNIFPNNNNNSTNISFTHHHNNRSSIRLFTLRNDINFVGNNMNDVNKWTIQSTTEQAERGKTNMFIDVILLGDLLQKNKQKLLLFIGLTALVLLFLLLVGYIIFRRKQLKRRCLVWQKKVEQYDMMNKRKKINENSVDRTLPDQFEKDALNEASSKSFYYHSENNGHFRPKNDKMITDNESNDIKWKTMTAAQKANRRISPICVAHRPENVPLLNNNSTTVVPVRLSFPIHHQRNCNSEKLVHRSLKKPSGKNKRKLFVFSQVIHSLVEL
ncbi:hypothetical protein SNEBB_011247 [Seison nebaliae]|nr:hypothetical protein SNEBB_011247 [Seison nebaliae]